MEIVYYAYHIMVGLGTMFIALIRHRRVSSLARQAVQRTRHLVGADVGDAVPLHRESRRMGGGGSRAAALGGVRTSANRECEHRMNVTAGMTIFTLFGFMGLYTAGRSSFICCLIARIVNQGPQDAAGTGDWQCRHGRSSRGPGAMNAVWFVLLAAHAGRLRGAGRVRSRGRHDAFALGRTRGSAGC